MNPARLLVVSLAWVVTAVLAVIAFGRLVHLDDAIGWPYPALNGLTPLLYLPAYAALAVGFGLRRNLLMIVAAVVVVAHLVWTVPQVWPGHPQRVPAGAVPLRLMAANLRYDNPDGGRLGPQIRAANPDVLVIEELSPSNYAALRQTGALDGYRYTSVHIDTQALAFGVGVFSREPLSDAQVPAVGGLPSLRLTVTLAGGRHVRLFAVHTLSPTTGPYTHRWRVQLADLKREAASAGMPAVLAGDFNASPDHRPFRDLVGGGLRDAHDAAGVGWAPTWSETLGFVPPFMRIDHVVVTKQFAVTGYRTGGADGSDHLPIIVDLALS